MVGRKPITTAFDIDWSHYSFLCKEELWLSLCSFLFKIFCLFQSKWDFLSLKKGQECKQEYLLTCSLCCNAFFEKEITKVCKGWFGPFRGRSIDGGVWNSLKFKPDLESGRWKLSKSVQLQGSQCLQQTIQQLWSAGCEETDWFHHYNRKGKMQVQNQGTWSSAFIVQNWDCLEFIIWFRGVLR